MGDRDTLPTISIVGLNSRELARILGRPELQSVLQAACSVVLAPNMRRGENPVRRDSLQLPMQP
jgi:hypothetical protein